jgi:hypothetical protein
MKSKWIEHKGKRIFYVDCTGFGSDSDALRAEAQAIIALVTQQPENSVRALSNTDDTIGTPENLNILKGIVTRTTRFVRKRAVVGISGVRKALLDLINRAAGNKPFASFPDEAAARDWLVED